MDNQSEILERLKNVENNTFNQKAFVDSQDKILERLENMEKKSFIEKRRTNWQRKREVSGEKMKDFSHLYGKAIGAFGLAILVVGFIVSCILGVFW